MSDWKRHPLPESFFLARLIHQAASLPIRYKVIGWLFLFIIAYRAGLPVIYSAALAAVPWLLLPEKRK